MKHHKTSTLDLRYFPVSAKCSVLDYGFGSGEKSKELSKLGAIVTAVDIDEENIQRFKKDLGNDYPSIKVVTIKKSQKLSFADHSFDRIILNEVLEHVDTPKELLTDLYRVIKKDGIICVSTPTRISEKINSFLNPHYTQKAGHVAVYHKEKLSHLLESMGFRVMHVSYENFQFAVYWVGQSLLHVNPSQLGKNDRKTVMDTWYWKVWGMLHNIGIANVLISIGNHIFPKSMYVYATK